MLSRPVEGHPTTIAGHCLDLERGGGTILEPSSVVRTTTALPSTARTGPSTMNHSLTSSRSRILVSTLATVLLAVGSTEGAVEDGSQGGKCRGNQTSISNGGPLICVRPCAGTVACPPPTVAPNPNGYGGGGPNSTIAFCNCAGGSEPQCCHLVAVYENGEFVGTATPGRCSEEGCILGGGECKLVPVAVPVEQPWRKKAACR